MSKENSFALTHEKNRTGIVRISTAFLIMTLVRVFPPTKHTFFRCILGHKIKPLIFMGLNQDLTKH